MDYMSQVPDMLASRQSKPEEAKDAASSQQDPPSLVRKISHTKSGGQVQSSDKPTVYRIVSGGEDSQLCFWRYEHFRKKVPLSPKRLMNETVPTIRDLLAPLKPIRHVIVNRG
jgi:RNase adaptor protein for sRNA GlmZ degradation